MSLPGLIVLSLYEIQVGELIEKNLLLSENVAGKVVEVLNLEISINSKLRLVLGFSEKGLASVLNVALEH